jgi:UDP-N-acetylglucosamine 2-epimerase (non-hydrolysing)
MINRTIKLLICFGTRPEAIKLAPLIKELDSRPIFQVITCITSQHRKMLDQVISLFNIPIHHDLDLMTQNQSLEQLTASIITKTSEVLDQEKPDSLIVQGDTTTTFSTSLAAFYHHIPVAHVEAGLRTYDKSAPFPEEINRRMTSCIADWHFTPTERARDALIKECYPSSRIFVVGNTVIDALLSIIHKARDQEKNLLQRMPMLQDNKRMLLVTGHRRENFGSAFQNICYSIKHIAQQNPDLAIIYPVHLNPNVQEPVYKILSGQPNIHLIEPQDYLSFAWLLDRSYLILTDSGGVQEEAPSLGKPVLVMRDMTERPEAIDAGVACLVGTNQEMIFHSVQKLLDDEKSYKAMSQIQNPYGDGTTSIQIADLLSKNLT